jgi:DNA-binding GntR family transcriptional regulator
MKKKNEERESQKVASRLRDAILKLELRPGQVLDEAELADRMEVSRTPVREAIIQLISDGLVQRDGRKAIVATMDFDEVPKLYDALLVSSRLIQRLAAANRTDADLKAIESAMLDFESSPDISNGVERSEANMRFHLAISAAAGNRYFQAFYDSVFLSTIRLARACFAHESTAEYLHPSSKEDLAAHLAETERQHRVLFDAIRNRDVELADQLAIDHYVLTRDRVGKVLFRSDPVLEDLPLPVGK